MLFHDPPGTSTCFTGFKVFTYTRKKNWKKKLCGANKLKPTETEK